MLNFLPSSVFSQFSTKKSSRCFSKAKILGSSIVTSLEVIIDGLNPDIKDKTIF
jgi:hypothetical protein